MLGCFDLVVIVRCYSGHGSQRLQTPDRLIRWALGGE